MQNISTLLPEKIEKEVNHYFDPTIIFKAFNLLKTSQVRIDYKRGDLKSNFFIISGGVIENREHNVSLKIKKQDEAVNTISSCDCIDWNINNHCQHVAALFIKQNLKSLSEKEKAGLSNTMSSSFFLHEEFGGRPEKYGTIIGKARELIGVPGNLEFSSAQFLLTDGTVINYPNSRPFYGKLKLNLIPSYKLYYEGELPSDLDINKELITPVFEWISPENESHTQISLFEHSHLFNWNTGELLYLPQSLIDIIRKIRYKDIEYTVDDYLRQTVQLEEESFCELYFEGEKLNRNETYAPIPRIFIVQTEKKNHLEFCLEFVDDQENRCPIPKSLLSFVFNEGLLSSFKRKQDGYKYIESVIDIIEERPSEFNQIIRGSKERELLNDYSQYFLSNRDEFIFDEKIYRYDSKFLQHLICSFFQDFGENFFRFSEFSASENKISFIVHMGTLLQGISNFHRKISIYGALIYYDKKQIARWNSRIRFERRNSSMNWFELGLNISKEDLELVNNSDLDNDFVLTTKGLVLLTKDQKDLLKFMKRYTKYEQKEIEKNDEGDAKFLLPFNRARIFELFELKRLGVDGALTKDELQLCERLMTLEEMPEFDIPDNLGKIARPYQVTGFNWLRFLYENKLGACLADDMGLGKTLQTIMFIRSIYQKLNKVLIVCPVSIIMNWQNEFSKFSDLDIHIYYGGDRKLDPNAKIILTSYGVMKKEHEETFKDYSFDVLILDEVQHLKNLRFLGANAARNLNAKFRVCLTGTPVENDLSEFYNILDLSIPGIWGDLQFIRTVSTKKSRLLAKKTARPFILRRTKGQVLTDLPEKVENHIFLNFSNTEGERYKNNLVKIKSKIENVIPRKRYGEILKGLLELRQLCLWQKEQIVESTKVEFLMENLEQILEEGHQAIIFSQFTTYLDFIQKEVEKRTWRFSRIDGSRSFKRRQKDVEEFQSGKNPIFLISLKAGGVGLNLTAASYVFLMDPWWNPAVEAQAIDRAHRIGQKNKLTVYRPIIKDSVEEKVLKLQQAKRELFQDLMADHDDTYFTGKLTMNDFEGLFN